MKDLSKKSKRTVLRIKKQKLCDRINQSKSVSELEGWEKTFSYHSVLKDSYDWDYDYLLDLIEFKLKRMREYFWSHNIVENEKYYGDICNTLINLLHAGYKSDIVLKSELNSYVNTRNVHRFFNPRQLEFLLNENLKEYYLPDVREAKAKRLFWKYLEHHIEKLWD